MKKTITKVIAVILAAAQILAFGPAVPVFAANAGDPIVALGANLSAEQRAKVLELMQITEDDLENYTVLEITNEEEHKYLDSYIDPSVIGTKSLSSVLVSPLSAGSGLEITTHNISYCTESMYKNALITAGLEDAEVIVAAPTNLSGTAALIGAVKAYSEITGEDIPEEALETATNELVITGELGEDIADSEQASEIIAFIKQEILEKSAETDEDIREIIEDAEKKFDIKLTDAQIQKIINLMQKVKDLDIDVDKLQKQAGDIYEKIKGMGLDLEKVTKTGFFQKLVDWIINLVESILK